MEIIDGVLPRPARRDRGEDTEVAGDVLPGGVACEQELRER